MKSKNIKLKYFLNNFKHLKKNCAKKVWNQLDFKWWSHI